MRVVVAQLSESGLFWLALAGSVVPCLLWLRFFYSRDRLDPEPKHLIARLFLIGALPVAIVAGTVNGLLLQAMAGAVGTGAALVLTAVFVAPVGEETLKYLGTSAGARRNRAFDEPVDGMIYGSTVGLGFAAAETIDYLMVAYLGVDVFGNAAVCRGIGCFAWVALIRGFGSALLHAIASGIAGYGLSRRVLDRRPRATAVGWVIVAMVLHALWNGTGLLTGFAVLAIAGLGYMALFRRSLARSPHHGRQVFPDAPAAWFPRVPPPPTRW